jgi:hypothetical protein
MHTPHAFSVFCSRRFEGPNHANNLRRHAALLVGVVLGAAATHELHAQSKPPVRYVVTEIAVRNIPG